MSSSERYTLTEHLKELRTRIIIILIAVVLCSLIAYLFIDKILGILTAPGGKMIFIKPAEAFFARLKISMLAGGLISLPVILYQVWKFVNPGLFKMEKVYLSFAMIFSYVLFLAGAAFAFYFVLPVGVKFLLGMGTQNIQPLISVSSYIDFLMIFIFAFGLIFQLPLVILVLAKMGIVSPKGLAKSRKYVLVGVFVLGAIFTPDVFSQFMMAMSTYLLFEISVFFSRFVYKEKQGKTGTSRLPAVTKTRKKHNNKI
jgi:sec-independent protein translocase protein TatC